MTDDDKTLAIPGEHGRDVGKTFHAQEIDPLTMAGYMLRLVSTLRVESYEALIAQLQDAQQAGAEPIDAIMQMLQGADPKIIHGLITDLLTHVRIAPDPQHPGVRRNLLSTDIRELRTLGRVLMGVAQLNMDLGG